MTTEFVMTDESAVFSHFWYMVDGKLRKSPGNCFVKDLKELWGAKEIRKPTPLQMRECGKVG